MTSLKLYRIVVQLEIEAEDEDEAMRAAEDQCGMAFDTVATCNLIEDYGTEKSAR